jgi:hypothetical protein
MVNEKERTRALTVKCTYCNAQPGEPCINKATNQPFQYAPAHPCRLVDSIEVPF